LLRQNCAHGLLFFTSLQELFTGLRRYQRAANASADEDEVEEIVKALMSQDMDGDQALDREEFAAAMVNYADAMHTDLHQLIDFMCVVTALGDVS
jgi:Ca2+-binding EF-hand superfamily protein